jgi:hypothetical protein
VIEPDGAALQIASTGRAPSPTTLSTREKGVKRPQRERRAPGSKATPGASRSREVSTDKGNRSPASAEGADARTRRQPLASSLRGRVRGRVRHWESSGDEGRGGLVRDLTGLRPLAPPRAGFLHDAQSGRLFGVQHPR